MYKGKRVLLCPFEWQDASLYRNWILDPEIMSLVDRVLPVTELEHRKWYEDLLDDPRCVIFAVKDVTDERFLGAVWLFDIHFRHRLAEVRIVIGEKKAWGKGAGTEALLLISQFAFKQLNLHKLYAFVLAHNKRAKKAFAQAGFTQEALFKQERYLNGHYMDVVRFVKFNENESP